jgi:FAD/FMN-containing dehydrogenase
VADVISAVTFARDHHLLVPVRGGGHGWLSNRYGLVSDNLTSVDSVTADGQCRIASDTEHPDLFWGVRGGGGNFGVATSFEYRLYPVGMLLAGLVFHLFERAKDVLQFYRDFSRSTHEEVSTYAALLTSAEGAKMVAVGVCYNGPLAEGERLIAPVRRFGPPLIKSAPWPTQSCKPC